MQSWQYLIGDVRGLLRSLQDNTFHCAVTSPPYWGLRAYTINKQFPGQQDDAAIIDQAGTWARNTALEYTTQYSGTGAIYEPEEPTEWWVYNKAGKKTFKGYMGKIMPVGVWGGKKRCVHQWGDLMPPPHKGQVAHAYGTSSGPATDQNTPSGQYCTKCKAWKGQLGLEPTPEEYVSHLVTVFREVWRVLRDDGVLYLNLGDSYATGGRGYGNKHPGPNNIGVEGWKSAPRGYKHKDLVGVPWMAAFALRADGWYLRSEIIWSKMNCMPESVRDRPTRSHEQVFMLTKRPRYFYDQDAIREPHVSIGDGPRHGFGKKSHGGQKTNLMHDGNGWRTKTAKSPRVHGDRRQAPEPGEPNAFHIGGRNRRTVWTINTKPFPEAHFATFPTDLVQPCIMAGSSEYGCCAACGAPYVRITEKGDPLEEQKKIAGADSNGEYHGSAQKDYDTAGAEDPSEVKRRILESMREIITVRWDPTCTCNAGAPVPCRVLDPFVGSGTVLEVSRNLGRHAVGIDVNPAYEVLGRKRARLDLPDITGY